MDTRKKQTGQTNLYYRFNHYFIPTKFLNQGFEVRRQARLLVSCTQLLALNGFIFSAVYYFKYQAHFQGQWMFAAALSILFSPFIFKFTHSVRITSYFILSCLTAILVILLSATSGLYGTAVFWFPIIPALAILLMSPKDGLVWGLCGGTMVLALYFAQQSGVHIKNVIPSNRELQVTLISVLGLGLMTPLLIYIYDRAKNRMLLEIHEARAEIDRLRRKAELAHRDARLVLDNVSQAMLLVKMDGSINPEYSKTFENWFGKPEEDEKLWDFIKGECPAMAPWLELVWFQLEMKTLSPELCIDQVPQLVQTESGRKLEFHLQLVDRSNRADGCWEVLIVITDVTIRIRAEESEQAKRELLSVFEKLIQNRIFIQESLREIEEMVDQIANDEMTPSEQMDTLHTLKGCSAIVGLEVMAKIVHELETVVQEGNKLLTEEQKKILKSYWKSFQHRVSPFISETEETIPVSSKDLELLVSVARSGASIDELIKQIKLLSKEPLARRYDHLSSQIHEIAKELNKEIEVICEDNGVRINKEGFTYFWGYFVHALRNAVDHGIESNEERLKLGKGPGIIRLTAKENSDTVTISISDDGKGIQWEKIRQKAEKMNLPAKTRKDLIAVLLMSGVSSKEEVGKFSGRGIGLSALNQCCEDLGGVLSIESEPGHGTRLDFTFAKSSYSHQVAQTA